MADPTPSYYPAGWDRERMLNAAVSGELNNLTEEQRDTFREGLRAHVGQQGFERFFDEMLNREAVSHGITEERIPSGKLKEPPFMEVMRLMEERSGAHWDEWGFVVFKSGRIADDGRWEACKERFLQIVNDAINLHSGYDGLDEHVSRMRFQWMDISRTVNDEADIEAATSIYRSLPLSIGLSHSVFLLVTPASMSSILEAPLPSSAKRRHRDKIPFVVAGSKDITSTLNAEPEVWKGYFKAAVETLLESLFPIIADDSMTPFEIGGHLTDHDIWCDYSRWGIYKMST